MRRAATIALTACTGLFAGVPHAHAQATDPAAAEVLFGEARELLAQGNLAEACPRFIESHRLDPATGTLLAVARCHEEQGLLATAWSEYTQAAAHAKKEGRADRMEFAKQRADALEPRLSTLTLTAAPEVLALPGLRVQRDGIEVSNLLFNRVLPIDGGEHRVELNAPGHVPERLSIVVEREGHRATLVLPMPKPERAIAATQAPPREEPQAQQIHLSEAPVDSGSEPGWTGRRKTGAVIGIAGLAAVVTGAGFLTAALIKKDQSTEYCSGNGECTDERGVRDSKDAVQYGNIATVLGIGGALLTGLGVTLFWLGEREDSSPSASPSASLRLDGSPRGGFARLELEL